MIMKILFGERLSLRGKCLRQYLAGRDRQLIPSLGNKQTISGQSKHREHRRPAQSCQGKWHGHPAHARFSQHGPDGHATISSKAASIGSRACCSARRHEAFTLVELLVVVAIIGVLLALAFPALNAGKNAANSARCILNLKKIGGAVFSYAADHDVLPGYAVPLPDSTYADPYLWFQALDDEYMGGNSQKGYSKDHPSWQECPSKVFSRTTTPSRWNVGYGWNYWAGTYSYVQPDWVPDGGLGYLPTRQGFGYNSRLAQVSRPAHTIMVGDSMDLTNVTVEVQNTAVYPPPTPGTGWTDMADPKFRASRHGGKGNYLMLDGHVEALPPTMDASYFKKVQ